MKKSIEALVIFLVVLFISGCTTPELPYISLVDENTSDTNIAIESEHAIKLGIASVISPQATRIGYDDFVNYLEEKLDSPVILIQGKTYEETNQLIKEGKVDIAFVCSLAYVLGQNQEIMDGIAAPEVNGEALYRSYLIAKKDSSIQNLEDLRGKRFAFTDPDSYSGRLAVLYLLKNNGESPDSFFEKIFYTYSHDYSVKAVASGLVDGAAVDSLVYDQMKELELEEIQDLKVIKAGDWVGTPPIVVSKQISKELKDQLEDILLHMDDDSKGKKILTELNIEEFVPVDDRNYMLIDEMIKIVGDPRWLK